MDQDRVPGALWLLVGAMAAVELVLSAADRGILPGDLRWWALLHGAFWRQLLEGVPPVYPGQGTVMFLSHAFLHGGFFHLVMNGVVLLALGKLVAQQAGSAAMLLLFAVSAIGGGIGFALLGQGEAPMVGASGAVFGFLALWQYWEAQARRARGLTLQPVFATVAALAAANVALAVLLEGALAWQAHLGGFVAGLVLGPVMTRIARNRPRRWG